MNRLLMEESPSKFKIGPRTREKSDCQLIAAQGKIECHVQMAEIGVQEGANPLTLAKSNFRQNPIANTVELPDAPLSSVMAHDLPTQQPHQRTPRTNSPNNAPLYAALDLGTNNCRLLVALPQQAGRFRVVDGFSRIVRLGKGFGKFWAGSMKMPWIAQLLHWANAREN